MIDADVQVIGGALLFRAGMEIDADGCPTAYAPHGSGLAPLDDLDNAGRPGKWWAVVPNAAGLPVVQVEGDPAPGYCVSTNCLVDARFGQRDPRRYADAAKVPFIVVPPQLVRRGVKFGDLAVVLWNGAIVGTVVGDEGPSQHYGEASIATADMAGVPHPGTVRHRGVDDGVTYVIFPGSHGTPAWPREVPELQAAALAKFSSWGGTARVPWGV